MLPPVPSEADSWTGRPLGGALLGLSLKAAHASYVALKGVAVLLEVIMVLAGLSIAGEKDQELETALVLSYGLLESAHQVVTIAWALVGGSKGTIP